MKKWPRTRIEAALYFCPSGKRILDVGCAGGTLLYRLKDRFQELTGVEKNRSKREDAVKKLASCNARVLQCDVEKGLPFEDGYFDTVVSTDVIQMFVDIFGGFKEMTRVLKKGGTQIVTTPNIADIRRRVTLLFGKFPATSGGNEGFDARAEADFFDGRHLHYFTFSMLTKLFKKYGYSTIRTYGFGSLGRFHTIRPGLLSPSCLGVGIK